MEFFLLLPIYLSSYCCDNLDAVFNYFNKIVIWTPVAKGINLAIEELYKNRQVSETMTRI